LQFAFDGYVLDADRRELSTNSEQIALAPQVFDLLLLLIRNRERVVSKDDLLQEVWSGRIVSESTLTTHVNAVRKAIGDNGQEQRLIRTVSRKGFRFIGKVTEVSLQEELRSPNAAPTTPNELPTLPDKPSIAVLPFLNLSGDPGQDYFIDGVVEDVIAALSRVQWLFVIARNSSFTYKGNPVDIKQVGRELGVRYVLEGSMRKAANRVRITGQLIDATAGVHIWAERFEGTLDDIFELQDQLATSVVVGITRQLERAEIERAKRKPTGSLDAYDYYLRGRAYLNIGTRTAIEEGLPLFHKAIDLDPDYASAYAMAAWCHFWRKVNGWMTDRDREIAEGARLARQAVDLGKDDAVALTRGGHALAHFVDDIHGSIALIDRALALDPNLAAAWFLGGFLRIERGEPEAAIEYFTHAMRFSPLDPEMFRIQGGMALAHLLAGRFDAASSWAEKAYRELPSFLMVVAVIVASHALAGRADEARRAMMHLRQLDPAFRISKIADWLPLRRPRDLAILADGLRKVGLPE